MVISSVKGQTKCPACLQEDVQTLSAEDERRTLHHFCSNCLTEYWFRFKVRVEIDTESGIFQTTKTMRAQDASFSMAEFANRLLAGPSR
jgi:hypothetical protein